MAHFESLIIHYRFPLGHTYQHHWKQTLFHKNRKKTDHYKPKMLLPLLKLLSILQKHVHVINSQFFTAVKRLFPIKNCDVFLIFAQNIDCRYTLEHVRTAVLTSTHNLCFRTKIRKKQQQFFYIKIGCKGVYISRTCYPDVFYSYSKVVEQKEALEQKNLHIIQILESERQAKWHHDFFFHCFYSYIFPSSFQLYLPVSLYSFIYPSILQLDGQKILKAYICCYILSCCL